MMATTHALVGAALAAVTAAVAPEYAPLAVLAGFAGGLAPDLDLYAGHRRTLHYPVCAPAVAAVAWAGAALWPGPATVAAAWFLTAAALHAGMDALGGGLELRPWEGRSERAVYDHVRGRWLRPRRWVRYDGAPEDVALAAVAGVPVALSVDGTPRTLAVTALAVSAGYALVRRRLPDAAGWLVTRIPPGVRRRVPERFLAE